MKTIGKRFYDLLIKLISVKTIPAIIFTIGYLQAPSIVTIGACLLSWALMVGIRYAEKVNKIMKG